MTRFNARLPYREPSICAHGDLRVPRSDELVWRSFSRLTYGQGVAVRDPRVDDYIAGLQQWQQPICSEIRRLAHAADPAVQETIKRSVQPYFVLEGNICALLGTKDHVNVFIYDPTLADPEGVINQGHDNSTARAIQIYRDDQINSAAVLALFREVIANNRAGGWRRLAR